MNSISFDAVVERHHTDLPVYIIVPAAVADGFGKTGTFVVDAVVEQQDIGRRSIKPWGDGRWFMEFTKTQCKQLGIAPGANISTAVTLAREIPDELDEQLGELGLSQQWLHLTKAQQRAYAESVFAAKRPATRRDRIDRIVASLQSR